jgi:hypothetical protein
VLAGFILYAVVRERFMAKRPEVGRNPASSKQCSKLVFW